MILIFENSTCSSFIIRMIMHLRFILLFFIISLFCYCKTTKVEVDTIVHNGIVYTVNPSFDIEQAIAIKDGKIVETGTDEKILNNYRAKDMINANGQPIYPGLIDAHSHFLGYGKSLFNAALYGLTSWEKVVEQVQSFVQEHPNEYWILGRGWDQNLWPDKKFPNNEKLNILFPNNPVLLSRIDGHAVIANDVALRLAGIQPGQRITGGEIETINGKLTGVLIDNATDLVQSKLSGNTSGDYMKWLTAAEKNCYSAGLTTVTDCGLMYYEIEKIDSLQKVGKLNMRLYAMLSDDTANYVRYLRNKPYKTDKLYVKGIKVYADGALGSRGACLLHPYYDMPNWSGFLLKSKNYFDSIATVIYATDYQMCTHAIGDSANRIVLDIYNKILSKNNDRRWRIEHAQVINEMDMPKFGKTSIVPSVQPTHATSDMNWATDRLGKQRIKTAYVYKQLLNQNGWIPLGTDFPVEDISPFKTFYAAVARKDISGNPKSGFQIENALSRQEALKGMTLWAARSIFLENEIGSIEKGKDADFIIVNKDIMTMGEEEILQALVISTFTKGKRKYSIK